MGIYNNEKMKINRKTLKILIFNKFESILKKKLELIEAFMKSVLNIQKNKYIFIKVLKIIINNKYNRYYIIY